MTTAPVITALTDLGTGTSLRAAVAYSVDAESIKILYREAASGGAWTEADETPAATIDVEGLTEGRMYEVTAVAIDSFSVPSLPATTMRAIPTASTGTVARRLERAVIAAIEAVTQANGHAYTVGRVVRIDRALHKEDDADDDVIAFASFQSIEHQDVAARGSDVLSEGVLSVLVGAGRDGQDVSDSDWVPDSIHELFASIQTAMVSDPQWGGLAIDTRHVSDSIAVPQELRSFADATALASYSITYRTPKADPHSNAA